MLSAANGKLHPVASVAPPPGLDAMTPAKVQLKSSLIKAPNVSASAVTPPTVDEQLESYLASGLTPCYAPSSNGEWFNAVMSTASHLNKQGLEQALDILDHAIQNVKYAKAMEAIISTSCPVQSAPVSPVLPHTAVAAELWRSQVCKEQQELMQRLLALRATGAVPPAGSVGAARPMQKADAMRSPPNRMVGKVAEIDQAQAEKPAGRQVQTLSTSLQLLSNEDPECLFIVRRINKLGFKASRKLKQHFSAHGVVVRVLVAHSTVRQHGEPQYYARRRPSSLGFMHMSNPEAVRKILALGEEQEVDGSMIRVQRFERQRGEEAMAEEDADADAELEKSTDSCDGWGRQHTASTSATLASLESHDSL